MDTFSLILILIVAVIASLPLSRLVPAAPLPVIQIAIGAALAWPVTRGVHVELEPEVFLLVFIPPLLFNDAWQAPKREFWQMRVPIASMAFGLVFLTILAFGYALHWLVPSVPLAVAFAAAAVLSPTDAVAVSSIIDEDKLPPRLLHLLEGESLLNDASGLVMFRFAVAAAATGTFSLAQASLSFIAAVVVGILAGLASIFVARWALKILSRLSAGAAESQVLVIIILPFLAYMLAERFHASGVLAAVTVGLVGSRLGLTRNLGISARMLMTSAWQMIAFALNGAIFVFLGLQLPAITSQVPPEIAASPGSFVPPLIVLSLTLCLMGVRYAFLSLGGMLSLLVFKLARARSYRFNTRMKVVAAIGGVRGAITLAGVLSLPLVVEDGSAFPARDLVIFLATGVILCWLAIASISLPLVTRGLSQASHERAETEMRRARISAAQAAIAKLESLSGGRGDEAQAMTTRQAAASQLIAAYRRRIAALEEGESMSEEKALADKAETDLREAAVAAEMEALRQMLRSGTINDQTLQTIFRELTLGQAIIATKVRH